MFDLSGMTAAGDRRIGWSGKLDRQRHWPGQGARARLCPAAIVDRLEAFSRFARRRSYRAAVQICRAAPAVDALVPQAVDALGGKLDILIKQRRRDPRQSADWRMKDEEFEEVIRINLEAAFRVDARRRAAG